MKKIIVLLGASATGKDTIAMHLSNKYNIPTAISYTTRPKRSGEVEGREYYFISQEEMDKKFENNEVMEFTSYEIQSENRTYVYASTLDELTKDDYVIVILNPHGLHQLQCSPLKDNLTTILLKCKNKERLLRAINRDENVNIDEVVDRYKRDKIDFEQNTIKTDYVMDTNKNMEEMFLDIDNIISKVMEGEE